MNQRHPTTLPSHDTLSRLALEAPQSFETLRLELIENCINGAREAAQLRLRQLQFRIDGIRQRSQSPLGAAIKTQKLMWESFLRMNGELQELTVHARRSVPPRARTKGSELGAAVLQFQARQPRVPLTGRP